MDAWFNTWVEQHASDIAANSAGLAGAFGEWAVGNPNFNCRDDGSSSSCDFNPCNIATLNSKGLEVRQAFYVMECFPRLRGYFAGLRQAFTVGAIGAALSKDNWATTFYRDKDVKQVAAFRELFATIGTVLACVVAFAVWGPTAVSKLDSIIRTLGFCVLADHDRPSVTG
ncbi:MAG: hypothetical protein Q9163_003928 [Psora crenata]